MQSTMNLLDGVQADIQRYFGSASLTSQNLFHDSSLVVISSSEQRRCQTSNLRAAAFLPFNPVESLSLKLVVSIEK